MIVVVGAEEGKTSRKRFRGRGEEGEGGGETGGEAGGEGGREGEGGGRRRKEEEDLVVQTV